MVMYGERDMGGEVWGEGYTWYLRYGERGMGGKVWGEGY